MRTSQKLVEAILGHNFIVGTNLKPYIDTANAIVSRVLTCATSKGVTINTAEAELIERWMSAHYYTQMDPLYTSRSTLGGSGSFVPQDYSKVAIQVDPSGCLPAILERKTAGGVWLGKYPTDQTPYVDKR